MRRLTMIVLTVLAGSLPAVPATAGHGAATSATPRDVLAGTPGQQFDLTVTHPPGGGPAIDAVAIMVPEALAATGGAALGWTAIVTGDEVHFSGGSIPPGGVATFRVTADVDRPSTDTCASWVVSVSSDGGASSQPATGDPAVCIRVLEVAALDIVSPPGATDGSVTRGQTVCVRMTIVNRGSAQVDAVPSLSGAGMQIGQPSTGSPCSEGEGFTIAPGDSLDISWTVTFDAAGTRTLTGAVAVAGSGEPPGPGRYLAVAVQDPVAISTSPGSLSPPASPGGQVTFSVWITKGPAGSPGIVLAPMDLELQVADCTTHPSVQVDLAAGDVTTGITFEPCWIDAAEGAYPATITIEGQDANGTPAAGTLALGTHIVDRTFPTAFLEIVPPPSRVPGEAPAVSSGRAFQVRGEAYDHDPETGENVPCGPFPAPRWCRILSLRLIPLSANMTPTGPPIEIPGQWSLTPGFFSATVTTTFPPGTARLTAGLTMEDWVGLQAASATPGAVEVDDVAPTIARATVVTAPDGSRRSVEVTLSEAICDANPVGAVDRSPTDWSPTPLAVEGGRCPGRVLTLVYPVDFPDDLIGSISYAPGLQRTRFIDRVGAELADATVPLT